MSELTRDDAREAQERMYRQRALLMPIAVFVGGIATGVISSSWSMAAICAVVIAVGTNAYLLSYGAIGAGKPGLIPMVLVGAIPAGLYDAVKVFAVAAIAFWIKGLLAS